MRLFAPVTPAEGCAWITGASSGIGKAVALALAREGWRVAVSARDQGGLQKVAQEARGLVGSIHPYALDVTDAIEAAEVAGAINRDMGPVAMAVLNAGIYAPVELTHEFDPAVFEKIMRVNYLGVVNCLAPLTPMLMRRGIGHLVIISSVTGYAGLPRAAAYGPTKAALINLAECLKFDLDRAGVRISVVCPGFVDTPATANNPFAMPFLMQPENAARRILEGIQADRFEISFPRRFTYGLKLMNFLPYRLYFWLMKRITGWN